MSFFRGLATWVAFPFGAPFKADGYLKERQIHMEYISAFSCNALHQQITDRGGLEPSKESSRVAPNDSNVSRTVRDPLRILLGVGPFERVSPKFGKLG